VDWTRNAEVVDLRLLKPLQELRISNPRAALIAASPELLVGEEGLK